MKKKELTHDQLDKVITLRQIGASWLKIQRETGINRRTAKRAYEKWHRSKSLEELKAARKDVAAQAFREHMDSLVTLATSLVANLNVPSSPDDMKTNAEEFLSLLWEQDLLHHYISPRNDVDLYTMGYTQPFHIGDPQFYRREKELIFESLKVHTREEIRWDDILDNRWGRARDNCAKIVPKLREETSKVVNNFLNQERQADFLQSIKEGSGEDDPAERIAGAVFREIWRAIVQDKLDEEGPWFKTVLYRDTPPQKINDVRCRDETVLKLLDKTDNSVAKKVTRICNLAVNNLCKGDMPRKLRNEVCDMEKASEELREMLNPVKLTPMILRTRCDLCPA